MKEITSFTVSSKIIKYKIKLEKRNVKYIY